MVRDAGAFERAVKVPQESILGTSSDVALIRDERYEHDDDREQGL